MAANLRGVRESGTAFAIPTYAFIAAILGMALWGFCRYFFGDLPDVASARFELAAEPGYEAGLTGLAGAFLLLRAFSSGCAALTGVEAISNGVPAFRKPKSQERCDHAAAARHHRRDDARQHHRAGQDDGPAVRRERRRNSCGSTARKGVPIRQRRGALPRRDDLRPGPGDRPAGQGDLRQRAVDGRADHHGDRADPGARRQHRVQRVPGARLDPGAGPLPPAAAAHARRPAGLQQRHHPAGAGGDPAHRRVRRRGDPADPALHRRRVRLVHPEPDRHGAALDPAAARPRPTRRRGPG